MFSVEAWHKNILAVKSGSACRARQFFAEDNLTEIFAKTLNMPHLKLFKYLTDLVYNTSHEAGHSLRSGNYIEEGPQSREDDEINSFYQPA